MEKFGIRIYRSVSVLGIHFGMEGNVSGAKVVRFIKVRDVSAPMDYSGMGKDVLL